MRTRLQPGAERRGWHSADVPGSADLQTENGEREDTLLRHRCPPAKRCVGTEEEEAEKERYADYLLHCADAARGGPEHGLRAYTETQLVRKVSGRVTTRLEITTGSVADWRPAETTVNAIRFLMSVSCLSARERFFLRAWMLGWTQQESAARWKDTYGNEGGAVISGVLKRALLKCSDSMPITFTLYSRHTIYRKPARRIDGVQLSTCLHCGEPYPRGTGFGRYCCVACRFAAIHS